MSLKNVKKYIKYQRVINGELEPREDIMNFWEWERIQRDPQRRDKFRKTGELDMTRADPSGVMDAQNENNPKTTPKLEIEDDPLECPLCGFVARTDALLKAHKTKEHG